MSITIENPTAETILTALRDVPESEIKRLTALLNARCLLDDPTYCSSWSEEDFVDLHRYTGRLIEKRFGPEEGDYG